MKKRVVIALVASLTLATGAATGSANAATADQKVAVYQQCIASGGGACCRKAGGQTVEHVAADGHHYFVCEISDDRSGPTGSLRPQYIPEWGVILYVA